MGLNKQAFGVFKEICKMSCRDSRCFAFTRHQVVDSLKVRMDDDDVNEAIDLLVDESYLRVLNVKMEGREPQEQLYEITPEGFEYF